MEAVVRENMGINFSFAQHLSECLQSNTNENDSTPIYNMERV